jgi:flagellar FliJ protein
MKKFKFTLQKLLDIREAFEKRIKNELAELVNLQNIERNKQIELQQRMLERKNVIRTLIQNKTFSYGEVMMYEKFTDSANKAINIAEYKIKKMEPGIQRVREKLVEASKEKKVVEKLKERKFKDYLYKLNREIAKENDDMNQKIFLKKRADDLYQ